MAHDKTAAAGSTSQSTRAFANNMMRILSLSLSLYIYIYIYIYIIQYVWCLIVTRVTGEQ